MPFRMIHNHLCRVGEDPTTEACWTSTGQQRMTYSYINAHLGLVLRKVNTTGLWRFLDEWHVGQCGAAVQETHNAHTQ